MLRTQPGTLAQSVGLGVAAALPMLLAYNLPPSATTLNQLAAIGAWGLALVLLTRQAPIAGAWRQTVALQVALACMALAAASAAWRLLPAGLALSAAGTLVLASLALAAGSAASASARNPFFTAWLVVGMVSTVVAFIQVFVPEAVDGLWIARSTTEGRAVGNLRQPNHLSTILLWAAAATVPLLELRPTRRRTWLAGALLAALLFGVVLSGSRTGLISVALLAAWGLLDARLSRPVRLLLIASPVLCAATGLLLKWLASWLEMPALGAAARFGGGDISSSRFAIWRDTLRLIADQPWVGVGFGEFNFAWSLTPMPQRPPPLFDHAHNLPLQLVAELGVPLGLLVVGLLACGLWQAYRRSAHAEGWDGTARRATFVMVLVVALHSLLEYPLWYAHFLLPTAFAWGLCMSSPATNVGDAKHVGYASATSWTALAGLAMMASAALALWDYRRVAAIYAPPSGNTASLAERIVEGRRSWFFAHHADYALVTAVDGANTLPGAFDRAPHHLLDTRLMIVWASGLAAQGDVDRARHIAARLREFRNPASTPFLAPCADAAVAHKPFQCSPPERAYTWRDFR